MNIFSNLSKLLFGRSDDAPEIIDGKIVLLEPPHEDAFAQERPPIERGDSCPLYDKEDDCPTIGAEHWKKGRTPKRENFFLYLEAAGRQKRTIQEYTYELKWWDRTASDCKRTVNTITAKAIEAAVATLDPKTRSRKLAAMKSYARWLLREGHPRLRMETEKLLPPKLPRGLPRDLGAAKFLEMRERARTLITEQHRAGIWIGLMIMGGLRISEIETAQALEAGARVRGKGAKERIVPLPQWVLLGMREQQRSGRGGWAKPRGIIGVELGKLGIRKPHTLRHTYAMELLRRGRKIEEIQALLGHDNIATTNIYARLQCPDGIVDDLDG